MDEATTFRVLSRTPIEHMAFLIYDKLLHFGIDSENMTRFIRSHGWDRAELAGLISLMQDAAYDEI